MLPCERKSVEPMAAITAPERTAAQHQSLLHFIGEGRKMVGREGSREGAGTGAAGAGTPRTDRSVDHRRYELSQEKGSIRSGWLDNIVASLASRKIQVAVTLSIANHDASLPVTYRLYLPKEWASDRKRRRKVGVPDEISFKTKPEIALA
jgi:SRSO17 transposase